MSDDELCRPEHVAFVRSIVESMESELSNGIFRDHLVRMLRELERLKRQ